MRSDAELMAATRSGDREAFGDLVDRYKDALVNYLTRLAGCRERAADLAQETFLRLYETRDRYQERGQLQAYLYRIATNLLRSERRRERRFRLLEPLLGTPDRDDAERGAGETLLASETQEQVARALARLPLRFRVPVVLHELEGWTYPDIARHLGCRVGTVKSRIHRGRKRLEDQLQPYWSQGLAVAPRPEKNGEPA